MVENRQGWMADSIDPWSLIPDSDHTSGEVSEPIHYILQYLAVLDQGERHGRKKPDKLSLGLQGSAWLNCTIRFSRRMQEADSAHKQEYNIQLKQRRRCWGWNQSRDSIEEGSSIVSFWQAWGLAKTGWLAGRWAGCPIKLFREEQVFREHK